MKTLSKPYARNLQINTRPEIELLLCCTRTYIDKPKAEHIRTLLQEDIDWEYLIQIASRHGLTSLLYWSLKTTGAEFVPQTQLNWLQDYFYSNNRRNFALTKELLKLLHLFEVNKITALPFKGPILATSVYGNVALRLISDLDILVHERDFLRSVDLLISQGYQLRTEVPWEFHLIRGDGLYNVDLHREITPKHVSCSLSFDYLWENIETFSLAGTTVPNLSPEVWLLVLCLNGSKDCWRYLNRICDIAELIRTHQRMNWKRVMEQATTLRCKRLIFLGLFLTANLLDTTLPDEVWQQIQSDSVVKSLAAQVSEQLFSETIEPVGEVEKTIFHIRVREHLRDRIRSFLALMTHSGWTTPTEEDHKFVELPTSISFLYYFLRPIRVVRKYGLNPLKHLVGF